MIEELQIWIYLGLLVLVFYAFIGWLGARTANGALPPADLRRRPTDDAIADACALLQIEWPVTDEEIDQAERRLLSRAPGDTFPDGTLRSIGMPQRFMAAELLKEANAFDSSPPYEARHLIAYWNYRAGVLGRLWGKLLPPAPLIRLRLQAVSEDRA